jgi:hypothetical protein
MSIVESFMMIDQIEGYVEPCEVNGTISNDDRCENRGVFWSLLFHLLSPLDLSDPRIIATIDIFQIAAN